MVGQASCLPCVAVRPQASCQSQEVFGVGLRQRRWLGRETGRPQHLWPVERPATTLPRPATALRETGHNFVETGHNVATTLRLETGHNFCVKL